MDKAVEAIAVDPRYPGIWDRVSGYFEEAIEKVGGSLDWDLESIYDSAIAGRIQIWVLVENREKVVGAGAVCVTTFPKRHVLEILFFGTEKQEHLYEMALQESLALARRLGCSAVVGTGRPAWAKVLNARERRTFEVAI